MHRFLISYLLMETKPHDLHAEFKNALKSQNFSEFVVAYDIGNRAFFSKLPHTTLWCVADNTTSVRSVIHQVAESIVRDARFKHKISAECVEKIKLNGGLLESLSVSYLLPPANSTILMSIQKGNKSGMVHDNIDLDKCLAHQKANP